MTYDELVERARTTLSRIEHASVATVSVDGEPWNSPIYFAVDDENRFYWCSPTAAEHSTNIRRTGRAFLAVYDSSRRDKTGAGVYIRAEVRELTEERAIQRALDLIYGRRNEPPVRVSEFSETQRAYEATALTVWTNVLKHRDGRHWDERVEISLHHHPA